MKPKVGSLKRSTKLTKLELGGLRKIELQLITKSRNENGSIPINSTEIKKIMRVL
jgi:hypothetical protein